VPDTGKNGDTWKTLRARQPVAGGDRPRVFMGQQIVVMFTEGVADLRQHRSQGAPPVMAQPETDGIEHVAQDPRETLQPDRAVGTVETVFREQSADPGFQRAAVARAVIGVMEGA
jgi:hypothetical protein